MDINNIIEKLKNLGDSRIIQWVIFSICLLIYVINWIIIESKHKDNEDKSSMIMLNNFILIFVFFYLYFLNCMKIKAACGFQTNFIETLKFWNLFKNPTDIKCFTKRNGSNWNIYNTISIKNLNTNNISLAKLSITKESFIVRIKTISDCDNLKIKLEDYIKKVPCFYDKFYQITPQASITKKLVFDSAHYITDHDGKCKNLHGGRYDIEIRIKDRIDPMTGFVIDYSLIKNVTKSLVINKFDHKTLNLTCPELSWRSSTEFLAIVIWEILIEYLPNLDSIKIYETETSFCEFQGSNLDDYLKNGPSEIVGYYKNLNREMIKEKVFAGK